MGGFCEFELIGENNLCNKLYKAAKDVTFLPVNGTTTNENKNMKNEIKSTARATAIERILKSLPKWKWDAHTAHAKEVIIGWEIRAMNAEEKADAEAMKNYHREVAEEKLNRFAKKN
jgi:hypothetical protein